MKRKTLIALVISVAMFFTACDSSEQPDDDEPKKDIYSDSSNLDNLDIGNGDNELPDETEAEVGIWDVIPEISVTEASAFTYKYDSTFGGMVITDYLKESPKVRIPETLEGEPVVIVALENCEKQLTEIVMPDTVKSFKFSSTIKGALKYVNLPRNLSEILDEAFNGAKNLEAIYAPSDCKISSIGEKAFKNCKSLTSLTVPDGVSKINSEAFAGCTALSSLFLPDSVNEVSSDAFTDDKNLIITNRGKKYDRMQKIVYSSTLTSEVCVGVSDFFRDLECGEDGMLIKEYSSGVFLERVSTALKNLVIPDNVTSVCSEAFENCTDLKSITIGSGVTKFSYGDRVPEVYSNVFSQYCENLTNIDVVKENTKFCSVDGMLCEKRTDGLYLALCPRGRNGNVEISDNIVGICQGAFKGCCGITSVTIPNSVTTIGEDYDPNAYNGILARLYGGVFEGCTALENIVIPDSVTEIFEYAFEGCTSLKTVTIHDGITEIPSGCFDDCENLTEVILPDSVTTVHWAFDNCEKVKITYKGKIYDYEHIGDLYSIS